ncbi:hypothetical protein FRC08_014535 [Ceratobasidium sp. 394]|nr:hypothetical protein FRC08_014535 [Ceratobasidium sp. 394]KAG9090057.1 hypothetical protein FS749_000838 [Ceratobasidium sp. UAMH 11750]
MSPPLVFAHNWSGAWENSTLSSLRENASPTWPSLLLLIPFTLRPTPLLTLSEIGSKVDVPHGYDGFSTWAPTPEMGSEPEEMLHGSPLGYLSASLFNPLEILSLSGLSPT